MMPRVPSAHVCSALLLVGSDMAQLWRSVRVCVAPQLVVDVRLIRGTAGWCFLPVVELDGHHCVGWYQRHIWDLRLNPIRMLSPEGADHQWHQLS
jgi:hypothetical protein